MRSVDRWCGATELNGVLHRVKDPRGSGAHWGEETDGYAGLIPSTRMGEPGGTAEETAEIPRTEGRAKCNQGEARDSRIVTKERASTGLPIWNENGRGIPNEYTSPPWIENAITFFF